MDRKIRVLLVDDETSARRRLLQFLSLEPDVLVIGECKNGLEACAKIEQQKPDLVFLDVEMPERNGFEVIRNIGVEYMPATIFATAYDHYALSAFESNAIDYLLKPFDQERFSKAMMKARGWIRVGLLEEYRAKLSAVLEGIDNTKKYPERLMVRSGDTQKLIKTSDILYISAEGNYIRLHTLSETIQIRERMLGIIEQLDPQLFRRIHRSHIVNLDHITKLLPWFGGDSLIMMADGYRLTLSRNYRDALKDFTI